MTCRIITSFGLFTMHPPSRPSQLRQLAYRSNVRIPGPHSDPDGWQALEPVQIKGKLFGDRSANAKCTVRCSLGTDSFSSYCRSFLRNRFVTSSRCLSAKFSINFEKNISSATPEAPPFLVP
jgi:hypothetical protein